MHYNKEIKPENLIGKRTLVLEDREMTVGENGVCLDSPNDLEGIEIDKKRKFKKGEVLTVRRQEIIGEEKNKCYVFSRGHNRTYVPEEEFKKIKLLQPGDLVQFGKRKIGTVVKIDNADLIRIGIRKGTMKSPGEETKETIKIGIKDISSVASLAV